MLCRIELIVMALAATVSAADVTIADFEAASPGLHSRGAEVELARDNPPQGGSYCRIVPDPAAPGRSYVRIPLDGTALFSHASLSVQMRCSGETDARLLWMALDESGRPVFQRRFTLAPGEKWVRIDEPLVAWRWDHRFVGDVDEVRELALRIDSPAKSVDLDDLRLIGESQDHARRDWVLKLAFSDRPRRCVEREQLLVASDAAQGLDDAALERLRQDMANARAFIRRVFGDGVQPTDDDGPAMLLIFSSDADQRAFFERLGEAWRVQITPPRSQGYTVQDIATATYRPELGPRRPVYLHESVHAIVARDLRLQSGYAPHTPMQEGIANYVQICVHAQSIERAVYVKNFAGAIDDQSFFKPLEALFSDHAEPKEYAQLASFVAFLVEEDPKLLAALAKALEQGRSAGQAVADYRTTWASLQDRWLAWGRQRFTAQAGDPDRIFEIPLEFRK